MPVFRRRAGRPDQEQLVGEEEAEEVRPAGQMDTISRQYESLDYDTNFNSLLLDEMRHRGYKFVIRQVGWVGVS